MKNIKLNCMRFHILLLGGGLFCLFILQGPALALTIYDAHGFERPYFSQGNLDGQQGWSTVTVGSGVEPAVVRWQGQNAVKLQVGNVFNDASLMRIDFPQLNVRSFNDITVEFDIYRVSTNQNLGWWWDGTGLPRFGVQWDVDASTYPLGWYYDTNKAPTVVGAWAPLKITWDFVDDIGYSWYNGQPVDIGFSHSGYTVLSSWSINLHHAAPTGEGGRDIVYIDNFRISGTPVPEPATLLLIGMAGIGYASMKIRRKP